MREYQRQDVPAPEPQVKNTEREAASTRDQRTMPTLIIGMAIAEESGRDEQRRQIGPETATQKLAGVPSAFYTLVGARHGFDMSNQAQTLAGIELSVQFVVDHLTGNTPTYG